MKSSLECRNLQKKLDNSYHQDQIQKYWDTYHLDKIDSNEINSEKIYPEDIDLLETCLYLEKDKENKKHAQNVD